MTGRRLATLLIVEDSATDRESYVRQLGRNPEYELRFTEASSGEEGLAQIRRTRPDCIVLDYGLPDTDGLKWLAAARSLTGDLTIPVVMLTGQGTPRVAIQASRAGAIEYLVKDQLSPEALNRAVTAALRAGSAVRESPRYHVLIVDDNATDAERYRRLLSGAGTFEFTVASTAADGLAAFQARIPDCVLLDYNLPDFDGIEFLHSLGAQQSARGQPMPVIVMLTGQGSESVAVEALKSGAHDYLVKDALSRETLVRSVTTAIEKFRLQARLKDKEHEFEQFCYAVAHDLQAPLRRASQFAIRLRRSLPAPIEPRSAEYLDFVQENIGSLQTMLRDLLSYYQVIRSRDTRGPVDINLIIETVLRNLAEQVTGRNARVTVEPMPVVMGYTSALTQLFQNLVENALKYTNQAAPEISLRCEDAPSAWVISVSDNGIGIDRTQLRQIFEPFHRAVSNDHFPGTGLGLAICEKVVLQHGGRIWAESDPGAGATFKISIPKATL